MARNVPLQELPDLVGEDLGVSRTITMSQERINGFAEVTEDRQWIHLDAERAAETPFGGTIAHGFLTLSLASALIFDVIDVDGATVINYGLDKVRFTAPVPSGSDIEMAVTVGSVSECRGGYQVSFDLQFRNPGAERPACLAALIFRYIGEA
ncbi:MaoC family dehydratase [uncultured Corynebacterium sp.]|uniref:MaoC family dehydratase n=1 Tax=uncultured Corynebacterium sp. TaxID=159447 RepID=UPI002620E4D2|nr:MaoC family dehydratase [uncultured Corynebacterium sp.]